jgi:hypothetical protein
MKRILSLLLAVASSMFLFVGATNAAEKFDSIARSPNATLSTSLAEDPPGLPCSVPDLN